MLKRIIVLGVVDDYGEYPIEDRSLTIDTMDVGRLHATVQSAQKNQLYDVQIKTVCSLSLVISFASVPSVHHVWPSSSCNHPHVSTSYDVHRCSPDTDKQDSIEQAQTTALRLQPTSYDKTKG